MDIIVDFTKAGLTALGSHFQPLSAYGCKLGADRDYATIGVCTYLDTSTGKPRHVQVIGAFVKNRFVPLLYKSDRDEELHAIYHHAVECVYTRTLRHIHDAQATDVVMVGPRSMRMTEIRNHHSLLASITREIGAGGLETTITLGEMEAAFDSLTDCVGMEIARNAFGKPVTDFLITKITGVIPQDHINALGQILDYSVGNTDQLNERATALIASLRDYL